MNQGTQGYSLTKKTEGRKSRDTVPLTGSEMAYTNGLLAWSISWFRSETLFNLNAIFLSSIINRSACS
jgi:hypothetical protein